MNKKSKGCGERPDKTKLYCAVDRKSGNVMAVDGEMLVTNRPSIFSFLIRVRNESVSGVEPIKEDGLILIEVEKADKHWRIVKKG